MDIIFSLHFADVLDNSFLNLFVQIAAYITPYFLIPATFKFGLGVFGNLAGMINDRGRGFFDRQRKFREGSRQKYRQRARDGKRFAGGTDNNWRGSLNKGISSGVNAPGAILDSGQVFRPGGGRWKGAVESATIRNRRAEIERNKKENLALQPWLHDDDVSAAAHDSTDAGSLRARLQQIDIKGAKEAAEKGETYIPRFADPAELESTVSAVETVRRGMSTDAFKLMTAGNAISGGTAYKDAYDSWKAIATSVTDPASVAAAVAEGRSASMSAGRVDVGGAGFGTTMGAVQRIQQVIGAAGPGGLSPEQENALREEINGMVHKDVYESQGGATLVHSSMKPKAVEEMAPEMLRTVKEAKNDIELTQNLASLAAVYDGLQGSSPKKARVIATEVLSQEINVADLSEGMRKKLDDLIQPKTIQESLVHNLQTGEGGGTTGTSNTIRTPIPNGPPREKITVQQAIEALRGDGEFKQMRREYTSEVDRVRNAGAPEPGTPPNQITGI
jgi:hypothetical protein